jgi:tRNA pseudouridine38-40 synthase
LTTESNRRFRLTLQYDGSNFVGWQLQPKGRTVQGALEDALQRMTGQRQVVTASGRTDTGVHATGQIVALSLPPRWEIPELHKGLNALLPEDVWVKDLTHVSDDFHPRFDAVARSYRYQLGLAPRSASPFFHPWCWPLIKPLDVDLLDQAAARILGDHSFKRFAKAGQEHRGDRCIISGANWIQWDKVGVAFEVTGNRFLHHMVRYLVGTMVEVGMGRRPLQEMEELLTDPDTKLVTSKPAPPQGLFLTRVHYPEEDSEG